MKLKMTIQITILFVAFGNILNAQVTEREVLANAGNTATLSSGYTVSWTLGETFVSTRTSLMDSLIVTEGFHQPEDGIISPTLDLPDAGGKITVSPNPTNGVLDITLSALPATPVNATLSDLGGGTLRKIIITDLVTSLDLQGLPAAVYMLSLTDGKQWVRSVKVVKQ
jgi:hypothetical protein